MTSPPQASNLDRLADETLQYILDLAMERDSPFYIDNPSMGKNLSLDFKRWYFPPPILESSTGAKDPLFSQTGPYGNIPLHQRTPQSTHRADWILINSTSRRIRRLGKLSFFRAKTIAMKEELPGRLQRKDFTSIKRMMPNDQALALSCIRDVVIVDPKEQAPSWYLQLPRLLAAFPCLRRCTLLFGFRAYGADDVEWVTAAFALANPVSLVMQELMAGIGLPGNLRLEETMGPGGTWAKQRDNMEKFVFPMLRLKVQMVQAKKDKERFTDS